MKPLILSLYVFVNLCLFSQAQHRLLVEEQYHGGLCFVGCDIGISGGNSPQFQIPIHIESGSTIKKVYLLYDILAPTSLIVSDTLSLNVQINNSSVNLPFQPISIPFKKLLNEVTNEKGYHYLCVADCSDAISSNSSSITLDIDNQDYNYPTYTTFYFFIEYENSNLPLINAVLYLNEEDSWTPMSYQLNEHNPMLLSEDISLGLLTTILCGNWDGYDIFVNADSLGEIYGKDHINYSFCAGTGAHFYHQNQQSYGLDDDIADPWVDSTDALINLQPWLSSSDFDLTFKYHTGYDPFGYLTQDFPTSLSNSVYAMAMAYSPACDATAQQVAFTDTSLCLGESIQLMASGGTHYQWSPASSLDQSNISNPICTPTTDGWYFCTISDNSSGCSTTQAVYVDVKENPTIENISTLIDTCGSQTGAIEIEAMGSSPLSIILKDSTQNTLNEWTGLSSGTYTATVTNGKGCSVDTQIVVSSVNPVVAQFEVNPTIAIAPAEFNTTNQSVYASDYIWYVNTDTLLSTEVSFMMEDTGFFEIQLIANNQWPQCSDTATSFIHLVPPISVNIPNVITPNQDDVNDVFSIEVEGGEYIQYQIFNRWGNLMFKNEFSFTSNQQRIYLWDVLETNPEFSDGTYFYIITIDSPAGVQQNFQGQLQIIGSGK